jgi:hypothetical protein
MLAAIDRILCSIPHHIFSTQAAALVANIDTSAYVGLD